MYPPDSFSSSVVDSDPSGLAWPESLGLGLAWAGLGL